MRELEIWDPFRRRKHFKDFFEDFFPTEFSASDLPNIVREPLIDVVDKGKEFVLTAELPGVKKEDIDINVEDNNVSISAEQKYSIKEEDKEKGHFYQERSYQRFFRRIPLSEEIDAKKVIAQYKEGILEITLPKKEPEKAKEKGVRVEVK
jgi:HSP20 family protein